MGTEPWPCPVAAFWPSPPFPRFAPWVSAALGSVGAAQAPTGTAPRLLSARGDGAGGYRISALDSAGRLVFDQPLPGRGHGLALHPDGRHAVCLARRPGDFLLILDLADGDVDRLAPHPRGPPLLWPCRLFPRWAPALHHGERQRQRRGAYRGLGHRGRLPAPRRTAQPWHRPSRSLAGPRWGDPHRRQRRHPDPARDRASQAQPGDHAAVPGVSRPPQRPSSWRSIGWHRDDTS